VGKDHPTAQIVRRLAYETNRTYLTIGPILKLLTRGCREHIICLIHQTNYLLDQQLRQLEKAFLQEGGFTERLYHARSAAREEDNRESYGSDRT